MIWKLGLPESVRVQMKPEIIHNIFFPIILTCAHVGVPCKMIKAASWQSIKALSVICGISIPEKTFIFSLETREKELIMKMNVNFNFSSYFWRIEMCIRNPVVVVF